MVQKLGKQGNLPSFTKLYSKATIAQDALEQNKGDCLSKWKIKSIYNIQIFLSSLCSMIFLSSTKKQSGM